MHVGQKEQFFSVFDLHTFLLLRNVGGYFLLLLTGIATILWGVSQRGNGWTVIFMLLLFQKALQRLTTGISYQIITYLDEIAEVMLLLVLLYVMAQKFTVDQRNKHILVCFLLWLGMTVISSIINENASIVTVILDCFVCVKFMVFYQGGRVLSKYGWFTEKDLYELLNSICKIISTLLFLMCIHDLILNPFFEKFDYRYFTESLQLCFLHPTYLAAVCMTCMAVLMYNMKYDKRNMKYIIMLSIVVCLTFRVKAIGALLVVFAVYFSSVKYELKTKIIVLIGSICTAVYFGMSQMEKYFSIGTSVPIRLKLLQDGINIAQQFFPLGAGFGSFGTTVSYESGSSFYYQLGYMSGYYANQPVGDAFWPGIFAEAGWIGTIFFGGIVIFMVIDAAERLKEDKYAGWCMLSILAYAIIASTAETAFFNPATAFMFVIYGVVADRRSIYIDDDA